MMWEWDTIAGVTGLSALNLWVAWRYSRLALSQDEGLWLLWGVTGAVPYRDFVDCKPPGIQLWLWLLARLTRRNVTLIRFLHHATVGGFAVAGYLISGRIDVGLLFTAIVQSSWLLAYHAWVEQLAAGFLLLTLLLPAWPATLCLAVAVVVNLKLGLPGAALMLSRGWWLQLAVAGSAGLIALGLWYLLWPESFRAVRYGVIEVPRRMVRWREEHGQRFLPPWNAYLATPLLLVAPAVAMAVWTDPDPALWISAAIYVGLNALGRVWRIYHWIPVGAFVAVAAPPLAPFLLLAEWAASGCYLPNPERLARPQAARFLAAAKRLGEAIRNMDGTLWVADEFTQIYVYAQKPPLRGMVEQVEIRHVTPEHRALARRCGAHPDLVVLGPRSPQLAPRSYDPVLVQDGFTVLARSPDAS